MGAGDMNGSGDDGCKYNVVFVLGGPGAGKGTQCQLIVQRYGYTHLSAGDLLRKERNTKGSQYGELIQEHITDGTIVPIEITCKLLEQAMEAVRRQEPARSHFLIDGFPRNKDNLDGWEREMADKVNLQFVLFFECDAQVCVNRCLSRGAAGSGRTDDNLESLKKRIETYQTSTKPIIEHYARLGRVHTCDAGGDIQSIFATVQTFFNALPEFSQ